MIISNREGLLLLRNNYLGEREWRYDKSFKFIFSNFGKSLYQTRLGDISIEENGFLLLNPNQAYRQLKCMDEKFLVEFNPQSLAKVADELGYDHTNIEFSLLSYKHPEIKKWAQFIRSFVSSEDGRNEAMDELFLESSLTQLSLMVSLYGAGSHQIKFPVISASSTISDVLDAVKQSYNEHWSLDDMVEVSGLSKFQFAHTFKAETGLSPYSWLQLYRLFRSQESLKNTNKSITKIALQYGFSSVTTYNQLFNRVYGKTPTQFRGMYFRD